MRFPESDKRAHSPVLAQSPSITDFIAEHHTLAQYYKYGAQLEDALLTD